jgi:O-antigen/teichoic acid export membrane protein
MAERPLVREERTLLVGTAANIIGLAAGAASALGVQVLFGRALMPGAFGLVTVAVQVAFVASAGSRFGMDLAALRFVAIGRGAGAVSTVRSLVDWCALIAFSVSLVLAGLVVAMSPLFDQYGREIAIAAGSIPFIAVANVYLGATRGLHQMRQTLYVFWIGQPLLWIAVGGAAVALGGETDWAVIAYDVSWFIGAGVAWALWRRETRGLVQRPASGSEVREALRFGLPRAPSALFAQSVFWADLWVLAAFEQGTKLDAYSAAARISQVLLLFLTSLNLVFSPFTADLYARGERQRLDTLFKRSTRWALTATLPLLIVLFVAADDVLHAFSGRYEVGQDALRILLLGQTVNVATGSVGFVLIMAGFTGVDLVDNVVGSALLVGLAALLTASFGIEGTAAAAAVTLAALNALRLTQVARRMGIQPYERVYLGLIVPAGAAALAALGAHAALSDRIWWLSLAATAVAGFLVYLAFLPFALPARERALLSAPVAKLMRR